LIISASRRTDIPAFYAPWFINRVRAGYCAVPNPYYPSRVSRVSLRPDDVSAFVFSTRNPRPLMRHLDELDDLGFKYYFLITLVNNPRSIDPKSPPAEASAAAIQELAEKIGPRRLIWRYDPIVLSSQTGLDYHLENFTRLAASLHGATTRCIISILDEYPRARSRLDALRRSGLEIFAGARLQGLVDELVPRLVERAARQGIHITSCAERFDLKPLGVEPGKCIDDRLLSDLFGLAPSGKKDPSQRPECGCVPSRDIGMYHSCLFGCAYCYATRSFAEARRNYDRHDPNSPSMLGWIEAPEPSDNAQLHIFS
jgi:hypothetical protein